MPDAVVLAMLRRMIFAAVAIGLIGSLTELALIGHFEDRWQVVPLAVLPMSIAIVIWHAIARSRASLAAMRFAMVLLMVASATGIVLHFRGNAEFQLEMDPSRAGWALFAAAMRATAPPALAPGNLALLGAIGLIATYGDSSRVTDRRRPSSEGG